MPNHLWNAEALQDATSHGGGELLCGSKMRIRLKHPGERQLALAAAEDADEDAEVAEGRSGTRKKNAVETDSAAQLWPAAHDGQDAGQAAAAFQSFPSGKGRHACTSAPHDQALTHRCVCPACIAWQGPSSMKSS